MKLGDKVKILGVNTHQDYKDREGFIIGKGSTVVLGYQISEYNVELEDSVINQIPEHELEHIPAFKVGDIVILKDIPDIHPDNRNKKCSIIKVEGKNNYWKNDEFEYQALTQREDGGPDYHLTTCESHMLSTNEKPQVENKCTCDIMSLMAVGCKCGQIQREREREREFASQILFQGKWV